MATLLLVDDDPGFHELARPVLERRGHRVLQATSAAGAEQVLAAGAVDGVVVDAALPDADAASWIARQRASGRAARFLALSTFWRDLAPDGPLALADLVLHKPVFPEVFAVQVEGVIGPPRPLVPAPAPADVEDELARLTRDYARALPGKVRELVTALDAVRADPADPSALARGRLLAHRLAGTAGSYGFDAAGDAAAVVEQAFLSLAATEPALRAPQLVDVASACEHLASEVASPAPKGRGRLLVAHPHGFVLPATLVVGSDEFEVVGCTDVTVALDAARQETWDAAAVVVDRASPEPWYGLAARMRRHRAGRFPVALLATGSDRRARRDPGGDGLAEAVLSAVVATLRPALVAEADPASFEGLRDLLRRAGLSAVQVTDPLRLVPEASRSGAALVAVGTRLGSASGFDLCRLLRESPATRELPVLFLMEHATAWARSAAFRAGADDVVERPLVPAELLARVRVRLDRQRLLRDKRDRDPVSGLLLRRPFLERLDGSAPLALALLELPGIASLPPDEEARLLGRFGASLREGLREADLCGCWGPGLFAVALGGLEARSAAPVVARLAERLGGLLPAGRGGLPLLRAGVAGSAEEPTLDAVAQTATRRLTLARSGVGAVVSEG